MLRTRLRKILAEEAQNKPVFSNPEETDADMATEKSPLEEAIMGENKENIAPFAQPSPSDGVSDVEKVQLDQISEQGRKLLKEIDDYKLFIGKSTNMMKNNPALADKIDGKKSELDKAAKEIFKVVMEMEDMPILKPYENALMGIPDENSEFDSEEEDINEDEANESEKDSQEEDVSSTPSDSGEFSSPNDLLSGDGEDPFMKDDETQDMRDIDSEEEVTEEIDEDISKMLPKQPTVQPQGNPKK